MQKFALASLAGLAMAATLSASGESIAAEPTPAPKRKRTKKVAAPVVPQRDLSRSPLRQGSQEAARRLRQMQKKAVA